MASNKFKDFCVRGCERKSPGQNISTDSWSHSSAQHTAASSALGTVGQMSTKRSKSGFWVCYQKTKFRTNMERDKGGKVGGGDEQGRFTCAGP